MVGVQGGAGPGGADITEQLGQFRPGAAAGSGRRRTRGAQAGDGWAYLSPAAHDLRRMRAMPPTPVVAAKDSMVAAGRNAQQL